MNNKRLLKTRGTLNHLAFAMTMLFLLGGCDGGITGTGPGPIIPSESTDMTDSGDGIAGSPVEPLDPTDPADPIDPEDPTCETGTASTDCTTNQPLQVKVIHAAPSLTDNVVVTSDSAAIHDLPGLYYTDAVPDYVQIDQNELTEIHIYLADRFRAGGDPLSTISVTDLASDSSLLIIRDKADDSGTETHVVSVDSNSQPGMAKVRIVHANTRLADDSNPAVYLVDNNAPETELVLLNLRYASVSSEYVDVNPGHYTLVIRNPATDDSLADSDNVITLEGGQVVTLVVRPDITTELPEDLDLLIVNELQVD